VIHLVCPKSPNLLTGGHIYNRAVVSTLQRRIPIRSILTVDLQARVRELSARGDPLVLDSLILTQPELPSLLPFLLAPAPEGERAPLFLMAHFLPSLDPMIPEACRMERLKLEQRLLAGLDGAFATSRFLRDEMIRRGMASDRIGICRPGVETAVSSRTSRTSGHMHPSTGGSVRLLTVANWTATKGHLFLLSVLEGLADLSWTWVIIGDVSSEPSVYREFRRRLRESTLKDRVSVRGVLEPVETRLAFSSSDLFVCASIMESYGMVFAESLAAGVPVVGNRVGGVPEAVEDGVTGLLCPPGDTARWRETLRRLISDPELRTRLSQAAAQRRDAPITWAQTAECFYRHLSRLMATLKTGRDDGNIRV